MKSFFVLAFLLTPAAAIAQEAPVRLAEQSTDVQLLLAIERLAAKIEALESTPSRIPVPVPIGAPLGDPGCDGGMVLSDPCAASTALSIPTMVQTVPTRIPARAFRYDAVPAYAWPVGWSALWRRELRQVGPYMIEVRPRAFGLLGSRVRVYQ